jgi:prevent-host-death family protein
VQEEDQPARIRQPQVQRRKGRAGDRYGDLVDVRQSESVRRRQRRRPEDQPLLMVVDPGQQQQIGQIGEISMREVGAFEAKNKLGTLLDWVENGEEVLITRRGKAVARLVPAEPGFDRAKARRAADGLLDARRGVTLGGLKIKDLVNEGRP